MDFNQGLRVGGTVVGIIGAISLPDDIGTWGARANDIAEAVTNNPLSAIAVAVGIAMVAIGFRGNIARLFRGSKRWRSDEALGDELHGWFRRAQFTLQNVDLPGAAFCFHATEPISNRPVTVLKINGDPGVRIQSRVVLTDNQKEFVRNMTVADKQAMLSDVALELARIDVGFDGTDLLNVGVMIVIGIIPGNAMTQFQFMQRAGQVGRCILVVQIILNRHLPAPDVSVATTTTTPLLPTP